MVRKRRLVGFLGVAVVNFTAMLIMCGVGVYGYAAVSGFGSPDKLSAVILYETLARCLTIPLSGMAGERIGRKRLFCLSTGMYIVAYAAASAASDWQWFAAARAVSGIAWGLFITNSLVMMSDLFSPEEAPVYSGYLQTVSTIAMAVGGPLAGILCGVGWETEFYVLLPVVMLGLVMAFVGMPKDTGSRGAHRTRGNNPSRIICRKLITYPYFILMLVLIFLYNVANATGNYLIAYAQTELHQGTFISSLITMPGILIAIMVTPVVAKRLSKDRQYKGTVCLWGLCSVAGFGIWWLCSPDKAAWPVCYAILLSGYMIAGIATGISQICPYTYPMHSLPEEILSTGVSLVGFFGAFGAVVSNAVCGVIQDSSLGQNGILRMALIPSILMLMLSFAWRRRQALS